MISVNYLLKYCGKCGKEIMDEAVVCPGCGCAVRGSNMLKSDDAPSTGFAVLGFFIPIVGLILYLINKDSSPLKAKSAGKGALAGVITSIVFSVIYGAIVGSMIGSMMYF